jgi:preprotein translocase subunit SecD
MMTGMKILTVVLAILVVVASASLRAIGSTTDRLQDGLYRVIRISADKSTIEPAGPGEKLLINDFHFLEPMERQATEYVVLQTTPFVPFLLAKAPVKDKDNEGKPKLFLQLSEDQTKPLEDFTRKYTGEKVAIVIGGDIVTIHKVREAITGGRIQITRCTDNGCEAIYTEVVKKGNQ